jgi:molybdopterin-binding protein
VEKKGEGERGKTMPRKDQGWITFQTSEEERKILEQICQVSQRTKTEILRELVRSLGQESLEDRSPQPLTQPEQPESSNPISENLITPKKLLKVSSRNVLKGKIKQVVTGFVNSEVTLEIIHKVELVSIITKTSAEELELSAGKEAYAVIKSSDVVIAME